MEDHQEFEKPIFELRHMKFRSSRVSINRKKKNRLGESMNHHEEIFCYYGSRENPKRTQKSPLNDRLGIRTKNRKRLIRCEECGKGFRYEKCLTNHREMMHSLKQKMSDSEDSMRRDLLCIFSSGVQRRKRSKRVSRYKKSPRFSVSSSSSSSFTNFLVSEDDGVLLEVAESLIQLSKSGEALVSNPEISLREFEDGFLGNDEKLVGKFTDRSMSNEHKLVGISTGYDEISKKLLGFLGDKKAIKEEEMSQLKRVGAGSFRLERVSLEDRPVLMLKNAETNNKQKLDGPETAFEDSNSGSNTFQMNSEYRCRLCDRVFSTYQALGGHQTFHRMKNKSEKSKDEMQRRVSGS